jgi:hypothetical protein
MVSASFPARADADNKKQVIASNLMAAIAGPFLQLYELVVQFNVAQLLDQQALTPVYQ